MMNLSKHQSRFTYHKAKLILYAFKLGIQLTDGEAYRTTDQQYLYFKGKTIGKGGELIDAPKRSWTMKSNHLRRLAQDFNFFVVKSDGTRELTYDYETIKPLGEYWEGLDPLNVWGGFWKHQDVPHFERDV